MKRIKIMILKGSDPKTKLICSVISSVFFKHNEIIEKCKRGNSERNRNEKKAIFIAIGKLEFNSIFVIL